MTVIELPDDDGTGFDAGDLGTAWLPFTEPRASDLEQLAIALIQHAKDMPKGDRETGRAPKPVDEVVADLVFDIYSQGTITPCGEMPRTWGHDVEATGNHIAALEEIADEYRNHCLAVGDDETVTWIDHKRGEPDAD